MVKTMGISGVLGLGYWVTIFIAAYVMSCRSQEVVRRKVQAKGRPVSGAYAYGYYAWSLAKAIVWPITLDIWFALGQPAPGTFVSEKHLDDSR